MSEDPTLQGFELTASEYVHLVAHAMSTSDSVKALGLGKKAISHYPNSGELLYLVGSMYADIDMYDASVDCLKRAIINLDNSLPATMQLGLMQCIQGDFVSADESWVDLEYLKADHPFLLFRKGVKHLIADEFQLALDSLNNGINYNTDLPELNSLANQLCAIIRKVIDERENEQQGDSHLLISGYKK